MRSARPKPLHLLCGRAMVLYVLDALPAEEIDRAVVVVGHGGERVTKKLTEDSAGLRLEFVEQHVQRGTGDAVAVGLTGLPDDDHLDDYLDVLVLPGDTPLLRPDTIAGARRRAPPRRRRLHDPHRQARRPHRLRPHRAGGQGRPHRPHRGAPRRDRRRARDRRDQHRHLLLPAEPAGAGAAHGAARQRAGRVLPHRRRGGAGRGRPPRRERRRRRPRRDPRHQRPRPARPRRGRAARAAPTPGGSPRASPWSTRPPPTSTPP